MSIITTITFFDANICSIDQRLKAIIDFPRLILIYSLKCRYAWFLYEEILEIYTNENVLELEHIDAKFLHYNYNNNETSESSVYL